MLTLSVHYNQLFMPASITPSLVWHTYLIFHAGLYHSLPGVAHIPHISCRPLSLPPWCGTHTSYFMPASITPSLVWHTYLIFHAGLYHSLPGVAHIPHISCRPLSLPPWCGTRTSYFMPASITPSLVWHTYLIFHAGLYHSLPGVAHVPHTSCRPLSLPPWCGTRTSYFMPASITPSLVWHTYLIFHAGLYHSLPGVAHVPHISCRPLSLPPWCGTRTSYFMPASITPSLVWHTYLIFHAGLYHSLPGVAHIPNISCRPLSLPPWCGTRTSYFMPASITPSLVWHTYLIFHAGLYHSLPGVAHVPHISCRPLSLPPWCGTHTSYFMPVSITPSLVWHTYLIFHAGLYHSLPGVAHVPHISCRPLSLPPWCGTHTSYFMPASITPSLVWHTYLIFHAGLYHSLPGVAHEGLDHIRHLLRPHKLVAAVGRVDHIELPANKLNKELQ